MLPRNVQNQANPRASEACVGSVMSPSPMNPDIATERVTAAKMAAMIIPMRSVMFKVSPFESPAEEVARSGSEIEHRIQPPMHADERGDFSNRKECTVRIGMCAASCVVPDRQPLIGHPEDHLGADHVTGQTNGVNLGARNRRAAGLAGGLVYSTKTSQGLASASAADA